MRYRRGDRFDVPPVLGCRERCSKLLALALGLVAVVQKDGERPSAKLSRKEAKRDDWMEPSAFQS